MKNWNDKEIPTVRSSGGVLATQNPWDNVVSSGIEPWPPPELIQKVYQSRHQRVFQQGEVNPATTHLGFYSDLQSLRSEDAITWSVFGPLVYASAPVRTDFVAALWDLIDLPSASVEAATVWLWRRVPHPDTLVPGGPEVDFGIQTRDTFLLGEAKWLSGVGTGQGKLGGKDQLTLRREFCEKYGTKILATVRHFVVLAVSPGGGLVPSSDSSAGAVSLHLRDVTWTSLCGIDAHPLAGELQRYNAWKTTHSLVT